MVHTQNVRNNAKVENQNTRTHKHKQLVNMSSKYPVITYLAVGRKANTKQTMVYYSFGNQTFNRFRWEAGPAWNGGTFFGKV